MLSMFSFCVNKENGEAAFAGNINPPEALAILQQLVIAEAVRLSKEVQNVPKEIAPDKT